MLPKKEWIENLQRKQKGAKFIEPEYVYDESLYAKYIMHTKIDFVPKQHHLNMLACHYSSNNSNPDYIENKLTTFVKRKILLKPDDYNKSFKTWEDRIKMAVRYSQTIGFKENKPIYFSKKEMDTILSQTSIKRQNVLFVLCCLAKLNSNINTKCKVFKCPQSSKTISKLSKVNGAESIIRIFTESKLIRREEKCWIINFLEKTNKDNSVLEIICDDKLVDKLTEYIRKG